MQVILECVVGSTLHGVAVQDGLEDLDLMAIAVEPASQVIGFNVKDVWVERTKPQGVRSEAGDVDRTVYGLRKWLSLALKGNPSVLLPLFAPEEHVRTITQAGWALRGMRGYIVSRQTYAPFKGYMQAQFDRLCGLRGGAHGAVRPELVCKYGYDTKYAMHVMRLGMQGVELLNTGRLTLPMKADYRKMLVDMRTGAYTFGHAKEMIEYWISQLDNAYKWSKLQEKPNYDAVEAWMIDTYQRHWRTR